MEKDTASKLLVELIQAYNLKNKIDAMYTFLPSDGGERKNT